MAVAPADYPALFRQYAVRSAQVTLDRVRAHEGSFVGAPQEQIFQALDFAMQLDEAWPWVKDVLLTIAPQMVQAGYQDGWAPYLVRGIELAETRGDVRTTAELQLNLGWLLQMRGDFDGADAWYAKSLAAFERLGDDNGTGRALSRQSFVACMCNEYERAQALAEHALSLFAPDDPERAAALNAVGRVAFYRGEFGDAQRAFEQALSLREEQGDLDNVARNLRDIGNVFVALHRFDEAMTNFERARRILRSARCSREEAYLLNNMGNVFCELHRFGDALRCYAEALHMHMEWQDELGVAVETFNLGYARHMMGDVDLAKPHFIAALRLWRRLGNLYMQAESLRYLGDVYATREQSRRARAAYCHAHILLRTLEPTSAVEELRKVLTGSLAGLT